MPGFDGTGSMGRGPGTGGGFGPCGAGRPRMRYFRGGGFGRGPGWGPGRGASAWRYGKPPFYYEPALAGPEDAKAFLQEQSEQLKSDLEQMEKRIAELEQQ